MKVPFTWELSGYPDCPQMRGVTPHGGNDEPPGREPFQGGEESEVNEIVGHTGNHIG